MVSEALASHSELLISGGSGVAGTLPPPSLKALNWGQCQRAAGTHDTFEE